MWYKVKFKPESPLVSELSSDILWGHLAWAVRYVFSREKLIEIISAMQIEKPPLLCSSIFPEVDGVELIPALKLPLNPDAEDFKELKKQKFIIKSELDKYTQAVSQHYSKILRSSAKLSGKVVSESASMRNVISRRTGTVLQEGGLFSTRHISFRGNVRLYCYIYCAEGEDFLENILDYISNTGFGADKTSGKGKIALESLEEIGDVLFEKKADANAFVSLSLFVPDNHEVNLKRSFYKTKAKIGRLGEAFASSNPYYKRPLWLLEEGSVCRPNEEKAVYGGLINNVHPNQGIMHYAFGIPYWINLNY